MSSYYETFSVRRKLAVAGNDDDNFEIRSRDDLITSGPPPLVCTERTNKSQRQRKNHPAEKGGLSRGNYDDEDEDVLRGQRRRRRVLSDFVSESGLARKIRVPEDSQLDSPKVSCCSRECFHFFCRKERKFV